ncbi:MAG: hypothetical protein R3E84_22480 [Pseudomonadales bacterium]
MADFRLRSRISVAAEVIRFSFLPPLLSLVVVQGWKVAELIYAMVHCTQIAWSYVNYPGLEVNRSALYVPLDKVLVGIGALLSILLFVAALLAPINVTRFGYTLLLVVGAGYRWRAVHSHRAATERSQGWLTCQRQ